MVKSAINEIYFVYSKRSTVLKRFILLYLWASLFFVNSNKEPMTNTSYFTAFRLMQFGICKISMILTTLDVIYVFV